MPHFPIEILVEKHIAVVRSVRQIVNDEDLTDKRAQFLLPRRIQCIAVHDETLHRKKLPQNRRRFLCVHLLRHGQPCRISRKRRMICMAREDIQRKALLTHQMIQTPCKITRDKMNVSTILSQPLRQCQAAHQVPASDLLG